MGLCFVGINGGEGVMLGNGEFVFFGVDGKNGGFRLGYLVMVFIF